MTEGELWTMNQVTNSSGHDEGIHLASLNWEEVGLYLIITIFIIFSGLAKVAFHNIHWLSSRVPESCLLVVVGVITGSIVYQITDSNDDNPSVQDTRIDDDSSGGTIAFPQFDASLFFYILLPPIILEASYSLYDKAFFDNLSTILVMAVIGTAINFLLIGFLLYFIWSIGAMGTIEAADGSSGLQLLHVLLFAALISAVDPVAVLAIFQEVGVNPDLYFLVFGESLLNDGVAVVFYKSMSTLAAMQDPIDPTQYVMMVGSFFSIALGGLLIGILVGFLTALMTKTMSEVRVMEPLALLSMAYFAYMAAEVFHWSGIISMIGCGIVQAHYAFPNISRKSHTTVKYFIKMVSSISDIVIFLFLGIAVVKGVPNNSNSSVENQHQWHTGFVVWTIALCLICRFLSVYGLTWLANRRRVKTINLQEQFIMAYGGLRGAVGFSLVDMIDRKVVPLKNMFVTTTLIVVMFTIFFQGMTIKFLVNLLNIEKKKDRTHLISEVMNDTVLEHIVSGIDAVSGHRGRQYWQTLFEYYDEHYLKKIFCKQRPEHDLQRLFEKLALSDHLLNLYGPTLVHEEGQSGMLLEPVKAIDLLDEDDENMSTSSSPGPGSFRRARTSGKHRDPELSQPLTSQDPPPLPPRSSNHSFKPSTLVHNLTASFRRRNHTIDLPTIASSASQTEDELRLSPRKGPNELSLVRHAFQSGSQRRFFRHDVDDMSRDQEVYAHLKERHAKARRISSMMLSMKDKGVTVKRQTSLPFSSAAAPGHNHHRQNQHFGDQDLHLGVEAVLRRFSQRSHHHHRSLSSSADTTYSNLNETRQSQQHFNSMTAEMSQGASLSSTSSTTTSANPSRTSNANNNPPPVERKKNAATGSAGRRKLTPHPLSNPDHQEMHLQEMGKNSGSSTTDRKLSVFAEDEESSSPASLEAASNDKIDKSS